LVSFSLSTANIIDHTRLQQVAECIKHNKKLSEEIYDCIRTNALEQLKTLLSQHSINLNSFNLSADGDTILHSAAKSNNVKMMEFVLQRISPQTDLFDNPICYFFKHKWQLSVRNSYNVHIPEFIPID
jgi:hypothetical protein